MLLFFFFYVERFSVKKRDERPVFHCAIKTKTLHHVKTCQEIENVNMLTILLSLPSQDSQSRRAASISRCKLTLWWQFMSCTYFQVLFEISLLPLKAPQWTYSNLSKSVPVVLLPHWNILSQEEWWAASISLSNLNKNTSSCQNLPRIENVNMLMILLSLPSLTLSNMYFNDEKVRQLLFWNRVGMN